MDNISEQVYLIESLSMPVAYIYHSSRYVSISFYQVVYIFCHVGVQTAEMFS